MGFRILAPIGVDFGALGLIPISESVAILCLGIWRCATLAHSQTRINCE
jgi:hypothetical protein